MASESEVNDEPLSSDPSSKEYSSDSTSLGKKTARNKIQAMVDKKIFLKFNKLTKTLKETRSNLLSVDEMLGKVKGARINKSDGCLQEKHLHLQPRRSSSVPPVFKNSCQLCAGDNEDKKRSQSMEDLDIAKNLFQEQTSKFSHSMQELRDPPVEFPRDPIYLNRITVNRADLKDQEPSKSFRGSENSIIDGYTKLRDSSFLHSPHSTSHLVDELRIEILSLKSQLCRIQESEKDQENFKSHLIKKEKQISELTQQMQGLSQKLEISEDQRRQLLLRLEDTLRTSLDVGNEAERFAQEVKRVEELAAGVEAEKEHLRKRAKKVVQDLKKKIKEYVNEIQQLRDREWELEQKYEQTNQENLQILEEMNLLRNNLEQLTNNSEKSKTEKLETEKILDKKDQEVAAMKIQYLESQKNMERYCEFNQKLLEENDTSRKKIESLIEAKVKLESQLSVATNESSSLQKQIQELKEELQNQRLSHMELNAQLLAESSIRKAVEQHSADLAEKIKHLEKQIEEMQTKYMELNTENGKVSENMRQELLSQRIEEEKKFQVVLNANQAQFESRSIALKLDLADKQAMIHSLQETLMKEKDSKTHLKTEIARLDERNSELESKYKLISKAYQVKKRKLQEKEQKIKALQDNLLEVRDVAALMEDDFKDILQLIHNDVEIVVNLANNNSNHIFKPMTPNTAEQLQPRHWLAEIKTKLQWLQSEMQPNDSSRTVNNYKSDNNKPYSESMHMKEALKLSLPVSSDGLSSSSSSTPIQDGSESTSSAEPLKQSESADWIHKRQEDKGHCRNSPRLDSNGRMRPTSAPICRRNGLPSHPFNSTEIKEAETDNRELEHTEILNKYQRFQKIFDNLQSNVIKTRERLAAEQLEQPSVVSKSVAGPLSATSSLSSISEFSCVTSAVDQSTIVEAIRCRENCSTLVM